VIEIEVEIEMVVGEDRDRMGRSYRTGPRPCPLVTQGTFTPPAQSPDQANQPQ
jgi:hypothetical protein